MFRSSLKLLVAPLLLLVACQSTPTLPEGAHVGETMEAIEIYQFATVDASPTEYFNRTLLVEAEVVAVCLKAGCWMQVQDEGKKALVRWETGCGGAYKFPEDAVGRRVLIQGSFYPKELSPEDREHLKQEAGNADIEFREDPYEFNASAVLVLDAQ